MIIFNGLALGWYQRFFELAEEAGFDPEKVYIAIGNHDCFNGTARVHEPDYSVIVERFLKYVQVPEGYEKPTDRAYYDFWLDGYHYIFLASEYSFVNAYISDEQLAWLEEVLNESHDPTRPVFVFCHQALYDTAAGSRVVDGYAQNWNGIIAGDAAFEAYKAFCVEQGHPDYNWRKVTPEYETELRRIFAKHPEIMFFAGHSHWTMDSEGNMYAANAELPNNCFNTSAVGYLWTDYNIAKGENLTGSQGYFVTVYADKVIYRGYDFHSGKWIPATFYTVAASGIDYGTWIEEDPATCETNGTAGHYHSPTTGYDYDADHVRLSSTTLPAGHTYGTWIEEVPATPESSGTKAHYHCAGCEKDFDADYRELTDLSVAYMAPPGDPGEENGTDASDNPNASGADNTNGETKKTGVNAPLLIALGGVAAAGTVAGVTAWTVKKHRRKT